MGNGPTCMDCEKDVPKSIRMFDIVLLDNAGRKIYNYFTGKKWFKVGNDHLCGKCLEERQHREKEYEKESEVNRKEEERRQQSIIQERQNEINRVKEERRQKEINRVKEERRQQSMLQERQEEIHREEEERRQQSMLQDRQKEIHRKEAERRELKMFEEAQNEMRRIQEEIRRQIILQEWQNEIHRKEEEIRQLIIFEDRQKEIKRKEEKRRQQLRLEERQREINRNEEERRQKSILEDRQKERSREEIEKRQQSILEERQRDINRKEEERRRRSKFDEKQKEQNSKITKEEFSQEKQNRTITERKEEKNNFHESLQKWKRDFQQSNQYKYFERLNQKYAFKGSFLDASVPMLSNNTMNNGRTLTSIDEIPKMYSSRYKKKTYLQSLLPRSPNQNDACQEVNSRLYTHTAGPQTFGTRKRERNVHSTSSRILRRSQVDKPSVVHKNHEQHGEHEQKSKIHRTFFSEKRYELHNNDKGYISPLSNIHHNVCSSAKHQLKENDESVQSDYSESERESFYSIDIICSKCSLAISHLKVGNDETYWYDFGQEILGRCIEICSSNDQARNKAISFLKRLKPPLENTCCDQIALLKVIIFVYFYLTRDSHFSLVQDDPLFKKLRCSQQNFQISKHPNIALLKMILCDASFHVSENSHPKFIAVSEKMLSLCLEECEIPDTVMIPLQTELQWRVPDILNMLYHTKAFIKKTSFLKECHFVQSCRLTPESLIDGVTVIENLKKNSLNGIRRLMGTEQSKNIDMILEEIAQNNRDASLGNVDKEFPFIKDVVSTVCSRMRYLSRYYAEKCIEARKKSDDIVDCLCTLSAAVFITHQYWPNEAQLASLCFLIETHKERRGLLLEIKTGEGKACLIAMFAAYLAIHSTCEWIDVVSSSVILAQRDSLEWTSFYRRLEITVGCNILNNDSEEKQRCYKNTVVYGTVGTFASDMLRQEFQMENVLGNRQCCVVLVDEVDCMLLDNGIQFTYLSHSVPGMHQLDPILLMIWNEVVRHDIKAASDGRDAILGRIQPIHEYLATIVESTEPLNPWKVLEDIENEGLINPGLKQQIHTEERKYGGRAYIDPQSCFRMFLGRKEVLEILYFFASKRNIPFQPYEMGDDDVLQINPVGLDEEMNRFNVLVLEGGYVRSMDFNHEKMYSLLAMKLKRYIEKGNNGIGYDIPLHLNKFIHERMVHWIENAFFASQMKNGREYVISNDQIIPVDFESTGVVELDTNWGDGLHQFLQIKHFLKLTPLGIVTNFMSNRAYFQRYRGTIYGVTGTVGNIKEKYYLQRNFGLECLSVPTNLRKKFTELPGIICSNTSEWYRKIIDTITYESQKQEFRNARAVLVICEDINTAHQIVGTLKTRARLQSVTLYARNDEENDTINKIIKGGDVIVATNIAGRGTDLHMETAVIESGGLFVLVTFLPQNSRVENQIFGRTARKGEPGSANIIIDLSKQQFMYRECRNIEEIKAKRDALHALKLSHLERNLINDVDKKETLFRCYCKFLRRNFPNFKDETEMKIAKDTMHEFWGFWLKRNFQKRSLSSLEKNLMNDLKKAVDALSRRKSPYENVSHIIKFANEKMKCKNYDDAESLYTRAIRTDPTWAAIAHYNRAFCYIMKNDESSLEEALDDLKRAKDCFAKFKHETLLCIALLGVIPRNSKRESNSILTNFETRCQILHFLYTNVSKGIEKLEEIRLHDKIPGIEALSLFTVVVGNDRWSKIIDSEIYLYWQIGLTEIIHISERERFSWKGALVAALGVMQVAIGIIVITTTSGIIWNVGFGFIFEGVRDIFTGVIAIIKSENDFITDWMMQKVARTVTSIVLIGFNQLGILDMAVNPIMSMKHDILPSGLTSLDGLHFLTKKVASKLISAGGNLLIDLGNSSLKRSFRKSCYPKIQNRTRDILSSSSFSRTLDKFIIYRLCKKDSETDIMNYYNEITKTLLSETQVKQLGPVLFGCVKQVLAVVERDLRYSNDDEDEENLKIFKLFDSCRYKSFDIKLLVQMYAEKVKEALDKLTIKQDFSEMEREHQDRIRNSLRNIKEKLKIYISKQLLELMEVSFEQRGSAMQAEKAEKWIQEIIDSSAPRMDFNVPSLVRDFWDEYPMD